MKQMRRRLVPHPLLTILLTIVWLALVNRFSLNSLLFGLILGLIIPFITSPYWPGRPTLRNPMMIAEYIAVVIWDIIVANVQVAMIVLFKPNANIQSHWIDIPLDLKRPEAITALSSTITLTPGTVTADLSSKGHSLLVHCLHTEEPDAVRDEIKNRYERRLMEIFE